MSAPADAAVDLLDGGETVPFIARHRKESSDGLDDTPSAQQVRCGDLVRFLPWAALL